MKIFYRPAQHLAGFADNRGARSAEYNWVMGRSVATAVHSKPVLGVPPTHKQITATFGDLHLFNDEGLIVEIWNLMDSLAIMQQIGLLK